MGGSRILRKEKKYSESKLKYNSKLLLLLL
jgi:hypothetical protein